MLDETATTRVKVLWPQMFPTSEVLQQDWQQVAVAKSIVQRFSVINGGPGTGKTYTVLRLLLALQAVDENINIVLAAPTGKAQQRMTESIISNIEGLRGSVPEETLQKVPTDAVTIHRLLGLREHTIATKFGTNNTLNLDVLIVDEASMVDLALMARIMRALPEHARLYFIGDADQLPAVELGNVLEQLVEGNVTSKLELVGSDDSDQLKGKALSETELSGAELMGAVPTDMRQHIVSLCPHLPLLPVNENAKTWVSTLQAPQRFKGQVAEVATAIQQGDAPKALSSLTPKNVLSNNAQPLLTEGVHLMPEGVNNTELLKQLAKESFTALFAPPLKENGQPFGPADALALLNAVRWLTPMRKGPMGIEGLNALVFDAIKHKIKRREGQFYQGQPIMIVKNHHPQRLSNGEVGVIWPDKSGKLQAWFEAPESSVENDAERGVRHISLSRLPQFETVFAMTIHKSQGSEFKHVVLILSDAPSDKAANLLHRGLVYTGLTRAKKGCLILAK
ncbi:MAG: exodeoxyribonuclease V subunit alpha, partial [Pseudomonadota bacterium]|nr:exodeoxyribonuclease V subunit alpha [Pseudomonadota bacterium]